MISPITGAAQFVAPVAGVKKLPKAMLMEKVRVMETVPVQR
jgi:hypothetical protein